MKDTYALLNDVYKCCELGKDILSRLIKNCKDEEFKKVMTEQFVRYHSLMQDAKELLLERDMSPKPYSRLAKLPIRSSMNINLKIDKTSTHFAEMLIQGSSMSLTEISHSLLDNKNASEEAKKLAEQYKRYEKLNINQILEYV